MILARRRIRITAGRSDCECRKWLVCGRDQLRGGGKVYGGWRTRCVLGKSEVWDWDGMEADGVSTPCCGNWQYRREGVARSESATVIGRRVWLAVWLVVATGCPCRGNNKTFILERDTISSHPVKILSGVGCVIHRQSSGRRLYYSAHVPSWSPIWRLVGQSQQFLSALITIRGTCM
jgi:hypothetical protein